MTTSTAGVGQHFDVCSAAYIAARPAVPDATITAAICARCSRRGGACVPVSKAISRTFTAFDGWADPSRPGLCFVCAWIYRTPELRSSMHLITRAPELRVLTPHALGKLLDRPLESEHAVVVPLRPGRKHVFPSARWGEVSVDDITLAWSGADALVLGAMRRLRTAGFGVKLLSEPAPPFQLMQKVPRASWAGVIDDWRLLDRWRSAPPWWQLGLKASVPTDRVAS